MIALPRGGQPTRSFVAETSASAQAIARVPSRARVRVSMLPGLTFKKDSIDMKASQSKTWASGHRLYWMR